MSEFGNTTMNDGDEILTGEGQMMRYNNFFSDTPVSPKEKTLLVKHEKRKQSQTHPRKHETISYSSSCVSRSDLKYRLKIDKVKFKNKFKNNLKTINSCMVNSEKMNKLKEFFPEEKVVSNFSDHME